LDLNRCREYERRVAEPHCDHGDRQQPAAPQSTRLAATASDSLERRPSAGAQFPRSTNRHHSGQLPSTSSDRRQPEELRLSMRTEVVVNA
jgi:hypothetical protein